MMRRSLFFLILSLFLGISANAQKPPVKKNTRPGIEKPLTKTEPQVKKNTTPDGKVRYVYEFEKAEFVVQKIFIEHDEKGIGTLKFRKKDFDEDISEPLSLSAETLEKLKSHWKAVNFLDSDEKLQSKERDYGHLGAIKLAVKAGQLERTEEFNWTENPDAKALADEYRKIGTQAIWMFDFDVAKKNQPLRTPRLMMGLDSYLRRNAISDPKQMMPFLEKLVGDESVPLIARNHASRLLKLIEKKKNINPEEKKKDTKDN